MRAGLGDATEELLAEPALAKGALDAKSGLGVDVPVGGRLLAPDRFVRAQFGGAVQHVTEEGAEYEIALAEAVLGILFNESVRDAAAKTHMARRVVQTQHVITE